MEQDRGNIRGMWMTSNCIQPNAVKMEVLWCTSNRQQHVFPSNQFSVCRDAVKPAKSVQDLGIFLDSVMSMKTHVSQTVSSYFAAPQHTHSSHLRQSVLLSLVTSLMLSCLNYSSVNLIGISRRLQDRLQSVLNVAARLVCNGLKYDHITPLLRDLQWLRIPECIAIHLTIFVFCCPNSTAPEYLTRDLY